MALNPFFLQGSANEQYLLQDLINEHLKTYGIEIYYIPRKVLGQDNIIREIETSKFDDNFAIEAYLENFEGYAPGSDIMTKFGINLQNEVTLTLSKERFEEFIQPFMAEVDDSQMLIDSRPREGDLVYFPLGERLFEIKRVEHEQPFYQLGTNYTYKLECELFQYENETLDTSIDQIDKVIQDYGYTTELILVGAGTSAEFRIDNFGRTGIVQKIVLTDDGSGYTTPPTVAIETSPALLPGSTAEAVAITTVRSGVYSIDRILLTNPGYGYTTPPSVTITSIANTSPGGSGVYGVGAAATAVLAENLGISSIRVTNGGSNYFNTPTISFGSSTGATQPILEPVIVNGVITTLLYQNAGAGYSFAPPFFINRTGADAGLSTVNFQYNEEIVGQASSVTGRVKNWNYSTGVLSVGINSGKFFTGEEIVGSASSARWKVKSFDDYDDSSPFDQNDEFETEGLNILDFSEKNPFGDF
jgi:hypothetical protein